MSLSVGLSHLAGSDKSRSTGFGSLQVWIRYLRNGIDFQQEYQPSVHCTGSGWTGSAFTIGGGYTWEDVYPEAAARNVVVVGGGTPVRNLPAILSLSLPV